MNHLDLAESFIERCASVTQVVELAAAFEKVVDRLGFRYFACGSHVDLLRPPADAVVLHNYPGEWTQVFSELKFYEIDPVFRHAERVLLPFFWNSSAFLSDLTAPQKQVLEEAGRFDVANGYTVPIHGPCGASPASCSVVPHKESIDIQSCRAVQLMAVHLYAAARGHQRLSVSRPQDALSHRELQCLELAAQGKTDWEVGKLLGISQWTVHRHIESAKRRLGVTTRVQAIVQALVTRRASCGDVGHADDKSKSMTSGVVAKATGAKKTPSDDR